MTETNREFRENKTNLNVWIDKDVKDEIKKQARRQGLLLSSYVEKLLKQTLESKEVNREK